MPRIVTNYEATKPSRTVVTIADVEATRGAQSNAAHNCICAAQAAVVHLGPTTEQPSPAQQPPLSLYRLNLLAGREAVEPGGNLSPSYRFVKRLMDIVGAIVLLLMLAPVMLVVLVVLTITTRGKPLFFQKRAGYLGKPFTMVKFRTMRPDAEKLKQAVENEANGPVFKNRRDPRVTRFGRWLRKTSLDETPQLFNVLLGQMSLVGPRPLVIPETAELQPWQRKRLAVKPGLTCLWQVSGRSEIGFADWARMDIWYVRNQNLLTDCKLLLRTPYSVLSARGAY